jgi:aspartate/glutamate racemase
VKTIGLIGGMSWESTAHYYSLLNKLVSNCSIHARTARQAVPPSFAGL